MSRTSATRQLLGEVSKPLAAARRSLRPHLRDIRAAWQKRLRSLGLIDQEIEALARLVPSPDSEWWTAFTVDKFQEEMESQALVLEARGLHEAQICEALGIYLECCLPYVLSTGKSGEK